VTHHGAAGVEVRQAARADLFDVVRIETRSFPQPWPVGAFERFLGDPGFLVAADSDGESDRDVVGFVVADPVDTHGPPVGHVKDIAVHPDHRERGVGATLLDRALAALRDAGAETATLEVREDNEAARSLYDRFGFDELRTVEGYYDDGEDAVVYVRDLQGATDRRE